MKGKKLRVVLKDNKIIDIPLTQVSKLLFFGDVFIKINSKNNNKITMKTLLILDNKNKMKYMRDNNIIISDKKA